MFRAVTSIVSALSGFVAKWPPAHAPVSPSPSKIPYGGFSPVRLQTGSGVRRRSSLAIELIRHLQRVSRSPVALWAFQRRPLMLRSDPEALGSPAGYAVPSDHRLLWPHLRLSLPPVRLSSSSDKPFLGLWPRAKRGSPIYSAHLSLRATSRTPMSRTTAPDRFFVAHPGLHPLCWGSAAISYAFRIQHSCVTRQQNALYVAAHRFACRSPAATFTIELSSRKSPFHDVDYDYAGIRSIPATGLSPVRHAA